MTKIYIGTSGFSYREWIGDFYPKAIKSSDILPFYAEHFNAVELNGTFYRLPARSVVESWKNYVPATFRFAVKASQRITHSKDFGKTDDYFNIFISRIEMLEEQLGPILFQFPPNFGKEERLKEFISYLNDSISANKAFNPVIEFRNKKLLTKSIFDILYSSGISICLNDAFLPVDQWPDPGEIAYIRLRTGPYTNEYLKIIMEKIKRWSKKEIEVYLFFKHEETAPELAQNFIKMLSESKDDR